MRAGLVGGGARKKTHTEGLALRALVCAPGWWAAARAKRLIPRVALCEPWYEQHNRLLADKPDAFHDHKPVVCQRCGGALSANADMDLIGEYDEIEIPLGKPHVVRHRRFACRCAACGPAAFGLKLREGR